MLPTSYLESWVCAIPHPSLRLHVLWSELANSPSLISEGLRLRMGSCCPFSLRLYLSFFLNLWYACSSLCIFPVSVSLQGQRKICFVSQEHYLCSVWVCDWISSATNCYFCLVFLLPMANSGSSILYISLPYLPSAFIENFETLLL